jgi:predicted phosphodiesterase
MKYTIISDIHSDYNSLVKVLDCIEKDNIDRIICLGDIVGYNDRPDETVKLIIDKGVICVAGNHDKALFSREAFDYMNYIARDAIKRNADSMSQESLDFLKNLPDFYVENNLYFVHGFPPASVFVYLFELSNESLLHRMSQIDSQIVFCGHTHVAEFIQLDNKRVVSARLPDFVNPYQILGNMRYVINPGSISMPRDRENRVKSYVVYDDIIETIEFKKITY